MSPLGTTMRCSGLCWQAQNGNGYDHESVLEENLIDQGPVDVAGQDE